MQTNCIHLHEKHDTSVFQIINKWVHKRAIMGRKCNLTTSEMFIITSELAKDISTEKISKIIGRYSQTAKKIVARTLEGR